MNDEILTRPTESLSRNWEQFVVEIDGRMLILDLRHLRQFNLSEIRPLREPIPADT